MASYSLAELAETLGARLIGDGDCIITGLATLQSASAGDLSFLSNPLYACYLSSTSASAVILHPDQQDKYSGQCLVSDNPYLAYARASRLFEVSPLDRATIHPSAVIHESANLHSSVTINANVIIEADVVIEQDVFIGPGTVIGKATKIGQGSFLHGNVSIYHDISIGENCIIHSGAVIGSDGFGFARQGNQYVKIAQLGSVVIGNDVEIGANTTIDRGALDDTILENGVKLDNQIQIAHNVKIGENSAMAGCVGVAGSTVIGRNCTFGGGAGILGHLTIVDDVHVTAMSLVTHSINEPGAYSDGTGLAPQRQWRKNAARFRNLDSLARRVNELEKQLALTTEVHEDE